VASGASRAALMLAVGLLLLAHPAAGEGTPAPHSIWSSPLHRDHALTGTIWSTRANQPVSRGELVGVLATSPLVLLGEVHDNADHHRLRAGLIGTIVSRRRKAQADANRAGPAIVFEQIRADQQPVVDSFLSLNTPGAVRLLQQLEWERSGWPPGEIFAPLFDQVLRLQLPILGGNAPSGVVRNVARQGLAAVSDVERARLGLDVQLDLPLHQVLIREIGASHCGMLPSSAFAPMAVAQKYRDAYLADVMLKAQGRHGSAVLIAGNGHVRADRGVPWHLRRRAPGLGTVVVAFAEVDGSKGAAESYIPRDPAGRPATDYVWFTPQAERADPCEVMRQRDSKDASRRPPLPAGP